jgi:hypothetical protein
MAVVNALKYVAFLFKMMKTNVVCSIGGLINVNIQPEDISISHRLKTRTPTRNSTPAIIVKFISRSTRDRLYYARKHLKDKTTSDIGFGRISDNKIYIAESLTSKNKELFKKCLDARRSLINSSGRIKEESICKKILTCLPS